MKNKITFTLIFILIFSIVLTSCSSTGSRIELKINMSENYDDSDPFIDERAIYISDDIDILELDITFQMVGESGTLEILSKDDKNVVYSNTWNNRVDKTNFTVSLDDLEKETEYIIRFTGIGIASAQIVITCDDKLVQEVVRPNKPSK